jgi:EmrB/QacA subfamily drug resistance transporter
MTATGGEAPARDLTHREVLVVMSGLMLAMFLAALDQTIVASAVRVVADDLNGLSMQAWATTSYLITATITTPLYGKLSDLYGRKPLLVIAMSVFLVGSVLSGFATSMYELAAFRAVQGLGAGGLISLVLACIGDLVAPRERARYQGYFLGVIGVSSVIGPLVGGFFADAETIMGVAGWRWVFLVNVPVGLVAIAVVLRVLQLPHRRRDHRIDWMGATALVMGLVPLLLVAEQGRSWGWTSPASLVLMGVSVLGLVAFVLAERRMGEDALIPIAHFRNRTFAVANGVGVIVGMGMFGGLSALPLYLQIVKGQSPTMAGLMLIPMTAGVMAGALAPNLTIARTGRYKIFPVMGTALMVVGLLLLATIDVETPLWQVGLHTVVFGIGLGFALQTLTVAVQSALPPEDMGVASSSPTFFRQLGGTLGTAVFLSILFSTVVDNIVASFRTIAPTAEFRAALADPAVLADPDNRPVLAALRSGGQLDGVSIDDSSFIDRIDPRLARPFLEGFADSMSVVFLVAACVVAVGFVLVLFLKEVPLPARSGIAARRDAAVVVGD